MSNPEKYHLFHTFSACFFHCKKRVVDFQKILAVGVPSYLQYHDIICYIVTSIACSRKLAFFECYLLICVFLPTSDTYIFLIINWVIVWPALLQYHKSHNNSCHSQPVNYLYCSYPFICSQIENGVNSVWLLI